MCQPESKGGERCIAHIAASKLVVRTNFAASKPATDTVTKALSYLNKEGKALSAPASTRGNKWIDTQRFVAQDDPDLDEHDGKICLSQLLREEEVKAGLTGGQFDARENLKEVARGKIARRLAVLALTPLIAFGAIGCSAGMNPMDYISGNTSQANVQEASIEGYGITDGTLVKDDMGEYSVFPTAGWEDGGSAPGPNSFGLNLQAAQMYKQNEDELSAAGYTQEDVQLGLQYSYGLLYEGLYDSTIIDRDVTDAEYRSWYQEAIASKYPVTEKFTTGMSDPANSVVIKGAGSESGGVSFPFVRDGNKRYLTPYAAGSTNPVAKGNTRILRAVTSELGGPSHMVIQYKIAFPYRLSYTNAIAMYSTSTGKSPAEVSAEYPDFTDDKGENILLAEGIADFALQKQSDGALKLTGLFTDYEFHIQH